MHDQGDVLYGLGANKFRSQIPKAQFKLRAGIGLRQCEELLSLAAVADKAPDVSIAMGQKAFDDTHSEKTASSRNQDFQPRTSG
jgi:hypothetical protein